MHFPSIIAQYFYLQIKFICIKEMYTSHTDIVGCNLKIHVYIHYNVGTEHTDYTES